MKAFLASFTLAAVIMSVVPASAAAPVTFRSTRWYDNLVIAGKALNFTARVIDGSIEADVERVQTITIEGNKVPVYQAIDANMAALQTHCGYSRRADGLSSIECKNYTPRVRVFPTISQ